ncbi:phosphatidate cytidylyltransferase [Fibrobacter sp. UWEL]|uniref:phosphatidate cytidylyltransferase n=1 Tax=Fibrobacter sp. UWEL TaxID=1896209 RepID=UPI00090EDCA3|nr:phosphatidate cytidylyltransferase [Fibrobacter sp. UWEL]SHL23263.1 phosphatidate cytidylyltransferase [Fibrobacter sp. UWEL]
MSNLVQRIITALVAIPLVFFLLWFSDYSRVGLMCFLAGVGAWEWAGMTRKMYQGPDMRVFSFVASLALTLAWALSKGGFFGIANPVPCVVGMTSLVILAGYIAVAYSKVEIEKLFPWLVMHISAPLYVGLWGGMNVLMMGNGKGLEHCYGFILVMTSMWICDTVAYFFGKFVAGKGPFGRHLFAPSISPKKTWEGSVAGTAATIAWVAYWTNCSAALSAFNVNMDWVKGIVLGLLIAIAGQAGDLLMSALKRWSNTKDSGNLFVGHGGVLDRCDSFLLAAPMLWLLLDFMKNFA